MAKKKAVRRKGNPRFKAVRKRGSDGIMRTVYKLKKRRRK